ncbi:MAG TPA: hypothetical protein VF447_13570, partial [Terriglobales bacterium]
LLWGDPTSAAAHAKAFQFCGSNGVELFEPLTFKGRRGSGIPGSRCAYADTTLDPHWDWQKYLYTYRSWGRSMYNPESSPESSRRYLRKQFGAAAPAMESALANSTPIMEIITTAHLPSAANEGFSPEYYTNQSIIDASKPSPYSDTPSPKVFGNVSPLDPQVFSTINEYATEVIKKEHTGKYSPLEVAQWLDAAADRAASHLAEAEARVRDKNAPEFRRAAIDLKIQIGIAHFFAAKFRSGVLYAAYEQTGDHAAFEEAVKQYRRAGDTWRTFAEDAKGTYLSDITFGTSPHQRGNWLDRIAAIDDDIAEMQKRLDGAAAPASNNPAAVRDFTSPPRRESLDIHHMPPRAFAPGQPLEIAVAIIPGKTQSLGIRLFYRHVNQSERYEVTEMRSEGDHFIAAIPADYTNSDYPLQYYFVPRDTQSNACLSPGLGDNLSTQPYYVVRVQGHSRSTS